MSGPVAAASICGAVAFLIVAFIGSSIKHDAGHPVRWFKFALGTGTGIFLLVLALFLLPGGSW